MCNGSTRPADVSSKDYFEKQLELLQKVSKVKHEGVSEQFKRVWDRFESAEKLVNLALASSKEAVQKAEESQQRTNVGQNEFRAALDDYVKNLATKDSMEALDKRVQVVEKAGAGSVGRTGVTGVLWGIVAAIFGGVVTGSIVAIIFYALAHLK